MSSKLQLTTLAVLVSAALPAQAALYKVVEVTEAEAGVSGAEYYGTAIQPSAAGVNCFDSGASSATCEGYKLAGETRNWAEGVSYREEVAFAMDNSFVYTQEYSDFEDYCYYELGYSTCDSWASTQWNGWYKELSGGTTSNSEAFVEGGSVTNTYNTVINALTSDSTPKPIGNQSVVGGTRNQAFLGTTFLATKPTDKTTQTRAWNTDETYVAGSISTATGSKFLSKATLWKLDGSLVKSIEWSEGGSNGDYIAQGSLRDVYSENAGADIFAVGYQSYDGYEMDATVFISTNSGANWTQKPVASVRYDGDEFRNSVLTDININKIAVGQAKRSGSYPQDGAAANRLFVVSNINSPAANFLSDRSDAKSVFFNAGAGGAMGSINNFNEIVGRVDVENHREYDGKQRRQRAFIYPYGTVAQGSVQERKDIFNNRAWIIDDLTNDGKVSGATDNNNQFRIYDATDINDAGVISATALKCAGGYDSVARDSYCGNGSTTEKIVAVKLVPIADPAERSIQDRPFENSTIERQGGSLGFGALTLLGLFGFMRKRIK